MSFRLLLPTQILQEMIDQARAELPNECCGLLAGQLGEGVGRVQRRLPLINAAASPVEYWSDGRSLLDAHKYMDREGLELLAIYHSHPTSAPIPSKKDRERSYDENIMALIISLQSEPPEVRAWWLTPEAHCEAVFDLIDPV